MSQQAYLMTGVNKILLINESTSFGRLPSNTVPINDPSVSREHATIIHNHNDNKYYLKCQQTINGSYVNGIRVNKTIELKHKDNIQFGKHPLLYVFHHNYGNIQKYGKINLKDYCWELDEQSVEKLDVGKIGHQVKHGVEERMSMNTNMNMKKELAANSRSIKIPVLADYLELQQSLTNSVVSQFKTNVKNQKQFVRQGKDEQKEKVKQKVKVRQQKVKLPQLNNELSSKQQQKYKQSEKQNNLYLKQQQKQHKQQQQQRRIDQARLQLQIDKTLQQQHLLKKQLQLQARTRDQTNKLLQQQHRIQNQLHRLQRQTKQIQAKQTIQIEKKQQEILEQLCKEKQEQLRRMKEKNDQNRIISEESLKKEFEERKRQLEIEAQALAKQYEEIYRQTIRKMQMDIDNEQKSMRESEKAVESLMKEHKQLEGKIEEIRKSLERQREEYLSISGRNKAIILYASELQNKIDRLKGVHGEHSKHNPTKDNQSCKISDPTIEVQIVNSRKLLYLKQKQHNEMQKEIQRLAGALSVNEECKEYLETVLEQHQQIQHYKQVYLQYLQDEKLIEAVWNKELHQYEQLQLKNRDLENELQQRRSTYFQSLKDNTKKLTQQRLNLLKCLHNLPIDKKDAAKYLIQQMLVHQQQIRQMICKCQQTHQGIHRIILQLEKMKQQNMYYAQLLFGGDTSSHHFDNMKLFINQLMDQLGIVKQTDRVQNMLKQLEEAQRVEVQLHEEEIKKGILKNQLKDIVIGQKVVMADKNPIIFFGDVLTQKQLQIDHNTMQINKLQVNISLSSSNQPTSGGQSTTSNNNDNIFHSNFKVHNNQYAGCKRQQLLKVYKML